MRLSTTAALGVSIAYGKILFWHDISEEIEDKKIPTIEYNGRTVYECFNNTFPDNVGIPNFNFLTVTIDDRPRPDTRAWYNPYLLPDKISASSKTYGSTFTNPYGSPQVLVITSDDPKPHRAMNKDNPFHISVKIGHCSKRRNKKVWQKNVLFLHVF